MRALFSGLTTVGMLLLAPYAQSFPSILSAWESVYPDSTSSDAECQLCHASANVGGEPWNAYGWDIREDLQGTAKSVQDFINAINSAGEFDQDGDDLSLLSKEEIFRGFQPGWRLGNNNTLFNKNETTIENQPPPNLPATTSLDFPPALIATGLPPIDDSLTQVSLQQIGTGFNAPLRAIKAPGIDGSLFVVEQRGKIFRTDLATGTKTLFLDVGSSLVNCGECGLLGLAFHPDFQSNGLFYTYQSEPALSTPDFTTLVGQQTADHQTKIVEYRASDPTCNSFISKQKTLLTIDQPQSHHNGGDLVFDTNGYLYVSLGDGGQASDYALRGHGDLGNGRDNTNILGAIIRVDPLGQNSINGKYGIPASNPFVGESGLDEIFAYGLRNPFRMSFDINTQELYTGDVGQDQVEEVNRIVSGGNYGWNWKEGTFFFYYFPTTAGNDNDSTRFISDIAPPGLPLDLIDPVGQYDHAEGISITGGYVYRGTAIDTILGENAIFGKYIFADLTGGLFEMNTSSGLMREFSVAGGIPGLVTGFGQDADNELYILTGAGPGGLYKIVEIGDALSSPQAQGESAICPPAEELCVPIKAANGTIAVVCL